LINDSIGMGVDIRQGRGEMMTSGARATWRTILLASASMAAMGSTAAWAQTAAADTDGADIVVTAQRVEQNLQDVPLSVTAVGQEQLNRTNTTDATRLENLVPGLVIGRSGTDLRPAIRGVRTENVGANADPTIGFFIDGIYQSRPSQALAGFLDLERVEVLRGPQGTLFGRNTYGGAINLVTARPNDDDFSGGLDGIYGRFNRARLSGFVNAPLSDGLSFRVAGAFDRMDGFVNNIGPDGDLGRNEEFYVRPSLRLESGIIDWVVRGTYWKQTGNPLGAFGYKSRGTMVDPNALSATNRGGSLGPNAIPVRINTRVRDGVADLNGFDIGVPVILDPYTVNFDDAGRLENELKQVSSDLTVDLGSDISFRSITGYTDWSSFRSIDNDFSPFPLATDFNVTFAETFSQELQLYGGQGSSFEWIVGAFYYNDKVREIFFNDQNNAFPAAGSPAAAGPPFQAGTPTGAPFPLTRNDSITPVRVRTRSLAGFGQATYRFSDRFAVTAGLRYTEDKKRYSRQLLSAPNLTFASGDTFDKWTYKVGLEFKPREDSLFYAQYSTGFTSGGFNGGTFVNAGVVTPLPPFAPQEIDSYEIGTKNRFADGAVQINAALFYNDLANLQVQSQVPFGGTVLSITGNAGQARSYGGEIETIFRPTRELTVGLNFSYLNAKYERLLLNNPFPNPTITCNATSQGAPIPLRRGRLICANPAPGTFVPQVDLKGNRIPYSPEATIQGYITYDIETDIGTFTPMVQTLFNSGYFNTDFNTLIDRQDAFTKTDLRLTWTSVDRRFTVQAFVENVEDRAVNQRGVFGANQSLNASYAMPRTYGVSAGVRF
jgi:iron complex outermembrane recepter protein